jgi:hypothetical protein
MVGGYVSRIIAWEQDNSEREINVELDWVIKCMLHNRCWEFIVTR